MLQALLPRIHYKICKLSSSEGKHESKFSLFLMFFDLKFCVGIQNLSQGDCKCVLWSQYLVLVLFLSCIGYLQFHSSELGMGMGSPYSNETWGQEECERGKCGVMCVINRDVSAPDPNHHRGRFWSPLSPVLKHSNCVFTNGNDSVGTPPVLC